MKKETRTEHESYREKLLGMLKNANILPEGIGLLEAIEALVDAKQYMEATKLLFGCNRFQINSETGFTIFTNLSAGHQPKLIEELARWHTWSRVRPGKGLVIPVYGEEHFVIKEPFATKVMIAVL